MINLGIPVKNRRAIRCNLLKIVSDAQFQKGFPLLSLMQNTTL